VLHSAVTHELRQGVPGVAIGYKMRISYVDARGNGAKPGICGVRILLLGTGGAKMGTQENTKTSDGGDRDKDAGMTLAGLSNRLPTG
jgi:hypothetical protein